MPMNQMMQGPSIPARDPRLNPPVRERGYDTAAFLNRLPQYLEDPVFARMFEDMLSRYQEEMGERNPTDRNVAMNRALDAQYGRYDSQRGRGVREVPLRDPYSVAEQVGAAKRLTQRGYNAP